MPVNTFKKMSMLSLWKKTTKALAPELQARYNMRVDDAHRLYTVLNIPEELVGDAYSLRTADINRISDKFLREFSSDIGGFLNENGLAELYDYYEIRKVDKYSYLVIIGFSLFRTDERRRRLFRVWLPVLVGAILVSSIFFLVL